MENFFVDDRFYHEIEDLIHYLEEDGDIIDLPDDWTLECMGSKLEPVFTVTADQIMDRVDEFRFPENWDDSDSMIRKILDENINYDVINKSVPKFYYPNPRDKFKISKRTLLL